jgi:hypothetical protein
MVIALAALADLTRCPTRSESAEVSSVTDFRVAPLAPFAAVRDLRRAGDERPALALDMAGFRLLTGIPVCKE